MPQATHFVRTRRPFSRKRLDVDFFLLASPADETINMLLFVIVYIKNGFVYKNFIFMQYSFEYVYIYAFLNEYSS